MFDLRFISPSLACPISHLFELLITIGFRFISMLFASITSHLFELLIMFNVRFISPHLACPISYLFKTLLSLFHKLKLSFIIGMLSFFIQPLFTSNKIHNIWKINYMGLYDVRLYNMIYDCSFYNTIYNICVSFVPPCSGTLYERALIHAGPQARSSISFIIYFNKGISYFLIL
jgi:hypothetical protein